MALIDCPECKRPGVSDQAATCPRCGHPIKKPEYYFVNVNGHTGGGYEKVNELIGQGWQIVDEHEEQEYNADGPFPLIVYKLMR